MCGKCSWQVEGVVRLPVNAFPSTSAASGENSTPLSLPTAAFICGICGNTILVNWVLAGVVER